MTKDEVAAVLDEIGVLLQLTGENDFRVRAYTNGSRLLAQFQGDFKSTVAAGKLRDVRGIGDALSQAHKAVTGDISGVTEGLGVAFNSTLIALLLSILLMLLLQQLQTVQERHVLDTETWLDQRVIRNLQARA